MRSSAVLCISLLTCLGCASTGPGNPNRTGQRPAPDTAPSGHVLRRGPLSLADRVAIYKAALRAAADQVFWPGTRIRLLLDPRAPVHDTAGAGTSELRFEATMALDSEVVRALALSGADEGICEPSASLGVCANSRRGLAAHLGPIVPEDSLHVRLRVFVNAVTAAEDRTWLLGSALRVIELRFVQRAGVWEIVP